MKICPQCQTSYTDDSLKFCLQDGTPLVSQNATQNWGETETLVSPRYDAHSASGEQFPRQNINYANSLDRNFPQNNLAPKKSRTGLIVVLTALVTLIVGGAGIAAFLYSRQNQKIETAQITSVNVNTKTTGNSNAVNANQKPNANAAATPTATPTPKPTIDPKKAGAIKSDVENVIANWKDSTENHDLEAHLQNYADTVDYYNAGRVDLAKVRADRAKAFDMYNDMQVTIDNVKITPDETGEKAVVTLDKEWVFENDEKSNSGKVQQQLTLAKTGGAWRITGEKDLKVYYVNK